MLTSYTQSITNNTINEIIKQLKYENIAKCILNNRYICFFKDITNKKWSSITRVDTSKMTSYSDAELIFEDNLTKKTYSGCLRITNYEDLNQTGIILCVYENNKTIAIFNLNSISF